ncbi:hypothetical protein Z965_02435 [Clostridium novyi A str. BKT29909]|uniref:hypothetical protein n=2 Tax=Clostridium novyi TaxID=1542 RepID=UPI0004DAD5B0|nr:hypothetical protein [Clostridium novyi]KEH89618.1 hypothetical protein Z965_02435 [Clostridium novyi A str. BKT29909]
MVASEYRIGKRLRHKTTKEILEIQEVNGMKMWVNLRGDIFDWVDEDLYIDLDYYADYISSK